MKYTLRYSYILICLLTSSTNYGQRAVIKQYLNTITRGVCDDNRKSCSQRQIDFFKACNELGELYFHQHSFNSALKYYLKASEINDHIYVQTNYARKLQRNISAKASWILLNKKHTHADSVLAFFTEYKFLSQYSTKELTNLSKTYFSFSKDTFYSGNLYNEQNKRNFLFAINPLFITNEVTQAKIAFKLLDSLANAKTVLLRIGCMDITNTEINSAYFWGALSNIKDLLEKHLPKIKFKTDVDFSSQTTFLEIGSFIWFPVLEVTINP